MRQNPGPQSGREPSENTLNPWEQWYFVTPWTLPGRPWCCVSQVIAKGNSLYPRRPAPGRGYPPWRQSCWSEGSGWRLWGTCWGCWCPSSPSTGRTSPGAQCPEPRLQVHGRAAAAVAGAGFSPVLSGTAGAGAAAAHACSGERTHMQTDAACSLGHQQAGRERLPVQEKQVHFI